MKMKKLHSKLEKHFKGDISDYKKERKHLLKEEKEDKEAIKSLKNSSKKKKRK